jgi:predicted 2-oxoglutarate/Fe(II)-dependent dioxygenase YbiX
MGNKNCSESTSQKLKTSLGDKYDINSFVITEIPTSITNSWIANRKPLAVVLHNVLSPEECQRWIEETESIGYTEALVNIGGGREMKLTDVRNSSRCIVDDEERSNQIWQRIKNFIPVDLIDYAIPIELNERLRFLRYDPGEYFAPHFDGCYYRESGDHIKHGDTSYVTVQVYLNEGFEGGSTRFFKNCSNDYYDVVPRTGSVLLFEHRMKHSGEEVVSGRKYALRTDVMFRRKESD